MAETPQGNGMRRWLRTLATERYRRWLTIWVGGITLLLFWDALFLNPLSFDDLRAAFLNSLVAGSIAVGIAFILGWAVGVGGYFLDKRKVRLPAIGLSFLVDLQRSIPQIVGIMFGYVLLTRFIISGTLQSPFLQLTLTAAIIGFFMFPEVSDLIRERIEYYRRLDFYPAMLCCGIPEWRIVNSEILRRNSIAHLIHKAVALFGAAIFLQCSVDFILSVGLSNDVSATNFPTTLGSLLARLDSKQDILAIGTLLVDPRYLPNLFIRHLQGMSVAMMIVFTLIATFQIANGLVRRYKL
jgi:ABC-type dipeptide/oligopeptide/nickel transport system permease subunit